MLAWLKRTSLLTAILLLVQILSALLLDRDFPIEIYEPGLRLLQIAVPDEWQLRGNSLLGIFLIVLVFAIYSFVLAGIFAALTRKKTKKD